MRDELCMVVGAAETLEPRRSLQMLLAPLSARDLTVRDISDEHVAERVLILARHRGAPFPAQYPFTLERMECRLGSLGIDPGKRCRRTRPEDLPEDGRVEQQPLLVPAEPVQARGDDALDRLRQRQILRGPALHVEPRELLRVERVPAGAV